MVWYLSPFWGKDEKQKRLARLYYERVVPVLNNYFDYVLIHGDPRLFQLESFFPWTEDIEIPIEYTGYVSEKLERHDSDTQKTIEEQGPYVLVSVGGGILGCEMITTAVQAWKILCENGYIKNMKMVVFAGTFIKDAEYDAMKKMCTGNFFYFSRFTNNFLQWMQSAELSISQAGYNTCMNVLETGVKAILVPIPRYVDIDQNIRAEKLAALRVVDTIPPESLNIENLITAMIDRLKRPRFRHDIVMDGALKTKEFIANL